MPCWLSLTLSSYLLTVLALKSLKLLHLNVPSFPVVILADTDVHTT